MPLGEVVELYTYRTRSLRDGVPTLTRAFNVEGLSPDVAIQVPNIPGYRDPHPDDSTLIARDISASPRGAGSLIQVTYSPTPYVGGSGPNVNTYAEDFIGKDVSFDHEDVDIPLFRRSGLTTTDGSGNPVSLLVYGDYSAGIPYRKRTPYYRVETGVTFPESATIEDVFNLTSIIVGQTDKIHTIAGKDLRFVCEGIDQGSATEFRVAYRWTEDLGIPNEWPAFDETLNSNLGRIGTVLYPFADNDFIIPPFQTMRIDGNTEATELPKVTFIEKFKREPNGWQNLPGLA